MLIKHFLHFYYGRIWIIFALNPPSILHKPCMKNGPEELFLLNDPKSCQAIISGQKRKSRRPLF